MKLDEIPKKNIYEVPADYFQKLPAVMMTRVSERNLGVNNAFTFSWQVPWLKSALAGLALLLAFIYVFLINTTKPQEQQDLFATVSNTEAMEYLINHDQVYANDLAILSQAEDDFAHEFIQASEEDLMKEIELADLNDITLN